MGNRFYLELFCEHTGERTQVGCDARITTKTRGPVTWKSKCVCGLPLEVVKWGDKCIIKHKKLTENCVKLHKGVAEIIKFPLPEDPIYAAVAKELKKEI